MAVVTGDRYLDLLVRYLENNADALLEGSLTLKLNPVGLHYVHTRLEAMRELEGLLTGAPVDYLRAYVSDLGDHRALEHLRRILRLLTSLKIISTLPPPMRDPTPVSLLPFARLRVLELRGCDLSTSEPRGLLELRHSLERLICHNSTEALRHIFASRIADIKDSPVWKRLSFISCACNGLLLMDESLQLLPVIESLDLSRNKFAKVDNLRKCTKLQYLDLGFNHLRTIASLSEVNCPIVKLVLRNNALTTLRGIENLKLVEGLDVSYNVISSFSELEVLSSLPSLKSLWLEGNPVCCARWYRAHIFSIFPKPEKLKLDDEGMSTREYWERQAIVAKRQKTPAGYGFYFPAKDDADAGVKANRNKKRFCRLVSIDEERKLLGPDTDCDSDSCDSECKDENAISDTEEEIINLINMVEEMKKERSVLWLREFKEWLDKEPEDAHAENNSDSPTSYNKKDHVRRKKIHRYLGESSMSAFVSDEDSESYSRTNIIESDISKPNAYLHGHSHNCSEAHGYTPDSSAVHTHRGKHMEKRMGNRNLAKYMLQTGSGEFSNMTHSSLAGIAPVRKGNPELTFQLPSPSAFGEIMGSRSSSTNTGSPPQFKDDILQRRHNLDELLQVSGDSLLTSSDSETSCSDDGSYGFPVPELPTDKELDIESNNNFISKGYADDEREKKLVKRDDKNWQRVSYFHPYNIYNSEDGSSSLINNSDDVEIVEKNTNAVDTRTVDENKIGFDIRQSNRKPKQRVISLTEDCSLLSKSEGHYIEGSNNDECDKPNHTGKTWKALPKIGRKLVGAYEKSAH